MATLTQTIDIASPAVSDNFNEIYEQIRDLITAISERMNLDHAFDGTENDDTDADCDGYHKKITMRGDLYDTTNFPENIPSCPTDGFVFFSIGGELCCYDGNTAKQITDGGSIAVDDEIITNFSGINLVGICYGASRYVAISTLGRVYTSTDGVTYNYLKDITTGTIYGFNFCGSYFIATSTNCIYISVDGETWITKSLASGTYYAVDYVYGAAFLIVGYPNKVLYTSDFSTYYTPTLLPTSGNEKFTDIVQTNTNVVITSVNESTNTRKIYNDSDNVLDIWVAKVTSGGGTYNKKLCMFNNDVIAAGDSFAYSDDEGNTFTAVATHEFDDFDIADITSGNGVIVAVGSGGNIIITNDYIGFNKRQTKTTEDFTYIFFVNDKFITTTSSGTIIYLTKYITLE